MPLWKYVTERTHFGGPLPSTARSGSPPVSATSMSHSFTEPITDDPKPKMGEMLKAKRLEKLATESRRNKRKLAEIAPSPTSECATDAIAPLLD